MSDDHQLRLTRRWRTSLKTKRPTTREASLAL
jgi:hypothetical protein